MTGPNLCTVVTRPIKLFRIPILILYNFSNSSRFDYPAVIRCQVDRKIVPLGAIKIDFLAPFDDIRASGIYVRAVTSDGEVSEFCDGIGIFYMSLNKGKYWFFSTVWQHRLTVITN